MNFILHGYPKNGPKWPHLTFKAFHPIAGLHLKLSKKGRTKGQINFNRWWQFQILVVVHACRGLGVLISPSPYANAYRVSWMTSTEKCVSVSASLLSVQIHWNFQVLNACFHVSLVPLQNTCKHTILHSFSPSLKYQFNTVSCSLSVYLLDLSIDSSVWPSNYVL